MFKTKVFLLFAFCFLTYQSLPAEIESVKLKWDPLLCSKNNSCNQQLLTRFQKITSVTNVVYNPDFGEATLTWKPNVPFDYTPINLAMRAIGLNLWAITIKIRGTISHQGKDIYLNSLGDNTRFKLLGNLRYESNRYTIVKSEYTHPLTDEMRLQLLQAEKDHQVVSVDGLMFEPERYVWKVIIQTLKIGQDQQQ